MLPVQMFVSSHLSVFQMCELLDYFCDCELKHRIEAIVSFSDNFVSKLQYNQKFRYNELMLALNMSAAVTAKKTKEFRSPPQEQVRQKYHHKRWNNALKALDQTLLQGRMK